MLGCFLISNGTTFLPIEACELVQPLAKSHNIVPLVLAETLNGLDGFHLGHTSCINGSPVLLQIWLIERLKLITPFDGPHYSIYDYCLRKLKVPICSPRDWFLFLSSLSWEDIQWHMSIWGCRDSFILHTSGCRQVKLMGLKNTSFYWASRVLRQMGQAQTSFMIKGHVHGVEVATPSLVSWAMKKWATGLTKIQVDGHDGPFGLDEGYKAWLKVDLGIKWDGVQFGPRSPVNGLQVESSAADSPLPPNTSRVRAIKRGRDNDTNQAPSTRTRRA